MVKSIPRKKLDPNKSVPAGTQFTVLEDFECEELKSHYAKGLSYIVREGNDVLAGLVPTWLSEGKVRLGTANIAKVEGKG